MTLLPPPNKTAAVICQLSEWDQTLIDKKDVGDWSLANDKLAQAVVGSLKDKLDIRPALNGLSIEATSYVGRVVVGPITITVQPKLAAAPLAQLLRYAYRLRDIATFDGTSAPSAKYGFHDILIGLLTGEVEELLHRGLARRYVSLAHSLTSPRGQIDVNAFVRQGGVRAARLPCRFHDRETNWALNRTVLAGLRYAARLASDSDLKHHINRLSARFADVESLAQFSAADLEKAEFGLTRLTEAYRPALLLLELLLQMHGIDVASKSVALRMPGYLFDMNAFYQRLLSRFLRENLVGLGVRDEYALGGVFAYSPDGNPRRLTAPSPRPDYALLGPSGLQGFLDAKYRDIWKKGIPASWLYQLSVYALASPARTSVLLYATMSDDAVEEQIDIRSPHDPSPLGSVVNRPVHLMQLSQLVAPRSHNQEAARQAYAKRLASLRLHRPELRL